MSVLHENLARPILVIGDVVSVFAIVGTWMGYLPDLAAGAAFIWYVVQITESQTGRRFKDWVSGLLHGK